MWYSTVNRNKKCENNKKELSQRAGRHQKWTCPFQYLAGPFFNMFKFEEKMLEEGGI